MTWGSTKEEDEASMQNNEKWMGSKKEDGDEASIALY